MKTLEAKQKERNELNIMYRIEKRKRIEALFADPINGARFRRFVASLNHFGPEHAERMVEYVRSQSDLWIGYASEDMRAAVLEAIGERIIKIREKLGLPPFDDSLPDEPDDVWAICKKVLTL